MWDQLFAFMIKFGFISLILYGALRSLIALIINNIYGGKLAVAEKTYLNQRK